MNNNTEPRVELLPCPAGHRNCTVQRGSMDNRIVWDVFCGVPACRWVISAETKAEAIAAWNTRAESLTRPTDVREAIEALEPFAIADEYLADLPDTHPISVHTTAYPVREIMLSLGDFRRAASAIRLLQPPAPEGETADCADPWHRTLAVFQNTGSCPTCGVKFP